MKPNQRNLISIFLGLSVLGLVYWFSITLPAPHLDPLLWVIFTALLTYTTAFGIALGGGEVSLVPMIALSAAMTMGIVPTATAMIVSDLIFGVIRWRGPNKYRWNPKDNDFSLLAITSANITMHALSVIAAGLVLTGYQGEFIGATLQEAVILVATGLAYLFTNYLSAAIFLRMRSNAHLRHLLHNLGRMLLYEAFPLVFAPLVAAIILNLGVISFIVFSAGLVAASNVLKDQAFNQNELKRHIQELESLQKVGQLLSTSLDEDQIAEAIYQEVIKLMPTDNFYLALYTPESDMIHFPVMYEHNTRKLDRARKATDGLTEYVIRSKKPILIEKNVRGAVEAMGIIHRGEEALSWLGVPLIVGDEALGMIAVQSYPIANQIQEPLNKYHQAILITIAAQAAIALQNARLYTQTDKALAQRVQELNSILDTTSEGMALISPDQTLLEINHALCRMLNAFADDLIGQRVQGSQDPTLSQLHIEPSILERTLTISDNLVAYQDEVQLIGNKTIPAKRTISTVRDKQGRIAAWLVVYRDLTEEHLLADFREDLTRMLIHDLRSPVVAIQGGLDMIEVLLENGNQAELLEMLNISRKGSMQMLGMINELLDLNQLETGKIVLKIEPVDIPALVQGEAIFLHSALQQANITLKINFSRNLPLVKADTGLLKRVFHNLIDNAIKFTPDGGIVEVYGSALADQPEKIVLGVLDTGPGIPKDRLEELFTKYFTDARTGSRRKGTGLGLHFCKLAVEAHQGRIWAENQPGAGCNIKIELAV